MIDTNSVKEFPKKNTIKIMGDTQKMKDTANKATAIQRIIKGMTNTEMVNTKTTKETIINGGRNMSVKSSQIIAKIANSTNKAINQDQAITPMINRGLRVILELRNDDQDCIEIIQYNFSIIHIV